MDLNLRGVDDELVKMIKATALSEGVTMKEFIVGILQRDVKRGGWTAPPQESASEKIASPIARKVASPKVEESPKQPAFGARPAHDVNCRCFVCKPPK